VSAIAALLLRSQGHFAVVVLAAVADDYGCPCIDARASAPMATRADASARRAPICSTHSPTCRGRAQPRAGAVAMARCPHMYAARLVRDHWVVPGSAWGCLPARSVRNEQTITSARCNPEGIAGRRVARMRRAATGRRRIHATPPRGYQNFNLSLHSGRLDSSPSRYPGAARGVFAPRLAVR